MSIEITKQARGQGQGMFSALISGESWPQREAGEGKGQAERSREERPVGFRERLREAE